MASFRSSSDRGSIYNPKDKDGFLSKLKYRIFSIKYKIDSIEAADDMAVVVDGTSVHREQILLGRKTVNIRKVYVEDNPLGGSLRYKVGWVIDKDLKCCMICLSKFNWFRYRHHCRSCGHLVCNNCSPYKATIAVFSAEEPTGSRVCKNCFGLKNQIQSITINPFDPSPNSYHPDSPHTSSSPVMGGSSYAFLNKNSDATPKGIVVRRRASSNAGGKNNANGLDLMAQSPLSGAHHIGMYNQIVSNLDNQHQAQYKNSYLTMRGLIPLDINKRSVSDLINQGLSDELATRIWSHRALWLIILHPDDIKAIHIADFRSKYNFQGLDLTEMRAIWFVLPVWSAEEVINDDNDVNMRDSIGSSSALSSSSHVRIRTSSGSEMALTDYIESGYVAKAEWRAGFKMKLDDMAYREAKGTLPSNDIRNEAYKGFENKSVFDITKAINKRFNTRTRSSRSIQDAPDDSDIMSTPIVMRLHLNKTNIVFGESSGHAESALAFSTDESCTPSDFNDGNDVTFIDDSEGFNDYSKPNEVDSKQLPAASTSTNSSAVIIHSASYLAKQESILRNKSNSFGSDTELSNKNSRNNPFRNTTNSFSRNNSPLSPHDGTKDSFVEHETGFDTFPRTIIPFGNEPSPPSSQMVYNSASRTNTKFSPPNNHDLCNLFPISREQLISLLETGNVNTLLKLVLSFNNCNNFVERSSNDIIEQLNECDELKQIINKETASDLLLNVVTDPLKLKQPLLTLMVLVEVLHADVNITYKSDVGNSIIRDSNSISSSYSNVNTSNFIIGKYPMSFLITHDELGSYLMARGADILQLDASGNCSFYESLQLGIEWMLDEFEENGSEMAMLRNGNDASSPPSSDNLRAKRYLNYLFYGGYATKINSLISRNLAVISSQDAASILNFCLPNYNNMKEPADILQLLRSLGLDPDPILRKMN